MQKTTEEMYRSVGFSDSEIEKIDKRTKELPNLLAVEKEEDQKFSGAMQRIVARQDIKESVAVIREQIASL
jgi:hypothetical protein